MSPLLPPPLTAPADLDAQLAGSGYAVLEAASLARLAGVPVGALAAWAPLWDDLPPDDFLKDGGRYRRRRHGCFVVRPGHAGGGGQGCGTGDRSSQSSGLGSGAGSGGVSGEMSGQAWGEVVAVPPRAHWQPVAYNALHGGIERWFAPLDSGFAGSPAWAALLSSLAACAQRLKGGAAEPWYVEAHPFRIDTTDGIGRPTPEGAHRDGVDLVVVILVGRQGIKGGETRVFDARGPQGLRFTLAEPWSALLLDDARVIHESTPIQPEDPDGAGHRDTLVLTFRRGGFQGPGVS